MSALWSGMFEENQATWMTSYGPEMRGATANCAVDLSQTQVGSPLISKD